jgi:hypothetical protein
VKLSVTLADGEKKTSALEFSSAAAPVVAPVPAAEPAAAPAPVAAPAPQSEAPAPGADQSSDGSSTKTLAWVALGAGGVGLAIGGVTGAIALGKRGSIDDSKNCEGDRCAPSEQGLVDSYNSMRTISTIGFIAGGVLAATGVVLLVTAPSSTSSVGDAPSAALWVSPNAAGVSGRF